MKPAATYQKLRGGYYTPRPIADFLARWAIQSAAAQVLEPSCGDGVLLQAAAEALVSRGASKKAIPRLIHGVEIDRQEAAKTAARVGALGISVSPETIQTGDFFAYCHEHLTDKRFFDAIIGNPPFIRYQNFLEQHRAVAFYLMRQAGLRPNRLTNSWVPFLVASTLLLKPGGRLAMVIPAELLQVNYAAELRYFISEQYHEVTLITFKRLVFEDVQQEVVLFLGERGPVGEARIRTAQLDGIEDLDAYRHTTFADGELKSLNHSAEKWTQYFLEAKEIALLRELRAHPGLARLGDYADVDVGIVTGLNEFFVLSERQVRELSLQPYTRRIVSRSGHLRGVVFSDTDWRENLEKQLPAYLLDLPNLPFDELPEAARDYVASGEGRGIHQGYKCRIRKRWYIVPSVWTPNAFMLRQVHAYPKIILNEAAATCTDTIHRIRLKNGRAGETLAAAFFNSLTFAFAEVMGRSYGGGVLELEPNEADELPLPLRGADRLNLGDLNRLVLAGDIDPALDLTDKTLLIDNLGLTRKQTSLLRGIWGRLRDRRVNRR